jgi:hypothetical protein
MFTYLALDYLLLRHDCKPHATKACLNISPTPRDCATSVSFHAMSRARVSSASSTMLLYPYYHHVRRLYHDQQKATLMGQQLFWGTFRGTGCQVSHSRVASEQRKA